MGSPVGHVSEQIELRIIGGTIYRRRNCGS